MRGFFTLPDVIVADLSVISAFATWAAITLWLYVAGWRIQRRYFIEATLTPFKRNGVVWASGTIGVLTVVVASMRPAAPAIVAVAMIGSLSGVVDWRTHRLPDGYTAAMGVGVAFGILCAAAVSDHPLRLFLSSGAGVVLWLVPMWLLSRLPGGVGYGDVKLAPVLGAMLGAVSIEAAIAGFILSFITAALSALWQVVVGSAGTQTRIPMGPWLIFSALAAHLLWGVLPDWF